MNKCRFTAVAASLLLSQLAPTQTVHTVGAGGFPTIQAAIDGAAPGDMISIGAGTYAGFQCHISLRFVAQPGAMVLVRATRNPMLVAVNLQPGERCEFVGMTFGDAAQPILVTVSGGAIAFEDCRFGNGPGLMLGSGLFVLRNCHVEAPVEMWNGHLSATQCEFTGASLFVQRAPLLITGGQVELANCDLTAGPAMFATVPASAALVLASSLIPSRAWLVDCTLTGGDAVAGGTPAPAVVAPGFVVRTHRCTLTGGSSPTITAPPLVGQEVPGPLLGVSTTTSTVTPGSTFALDCRGEPTSLIALVAGFTLNAPTNLPGLEQPAVGFVGAAMTVAVLPANAQGQATVSIQVPANPALRNLTLFFRGIDLATQPFQASSIVPMTVR